MGETVQLKRLAETAHAEREREKEDRIRAKEVTVGSGRPVICENNRERRHFFPSSKEVSVRACPVGEIKASRNRICSIFAEIEGDAGSARCSSLGTFK